MGQPASDALPVACIPMTPASAPGHMMAMVPPMMMHTHPSLPMQPQIMQQQMSAAQFHVQQLGPRPMAVPPPPPPPQGHAPHHGALGHQQQQMVQQMQQLHMQQSLQKQESPPHQPLKPEPHHHDLQEQQQHRDAQKVVESQPFAKVDKEAGGGGKEADRAGAGDRGGHGLGKGGSSRIRRGSTGRGMQVWH